MTRWHRRASSAAALAAALLFAAALQAQTRPARGASGSAARTAAPAASQAAAAKASAADYAERFATVCAACHGANGRSDMPGTPVLAGQHSYYTITQLFLYREGRRSNPLMTAVAKGFSDADLRGFSDYIGTLPPQPAPAASAPPDAARMKQGQALAQQHKCVFCHGADFAGGQQVPRIGGQREEYLRDVLQGYRSGQRVGYTLAMAEAVGPVSPAELDVLAYYAARVPVAGR
ncbi:MAG: c-type cytochrome [Burkholderiales bacterium]|nr:c-type cytochrome [Burkholderiales bacterium]